MVVLGASVFAVRWRAIERRKLRIVRSGAEHARAEHVDLIVRMVNRAYARGESGMWKEDAQRTNPEEVARMLREGRLLLARGNVCPQLREGPRHREPPLRRPVEQGPTARPAVILAVVIGLPLLHGTSVRPRLLVWSGSARGTVFLNDPGVLDHVTRAQ